MRTRLGLVLAALAIQAIAAGPPPLVKFSDLAKPAQFDEVKISPDGTYLAITARRDNRAALVILRLRDLKVTGILPSDEDAGIADFWWSSRDRIVASLSINDGVLSVPQPTGEIVGINADGSDHAYLLGARGTGDNFGGRVHSSYAPGGARFIAALPKNPKAVLVQYFDYLGGDGQLTSVISLDTESGRHRDVVNAPAPHTDKLLADRDGFVRYAVVEPRIRSFETYARNPDHPEWMKVSKASEAAIDPLLISPDGRYAYLLTHINGDKNCLVREALESGARDALACDATADITRIVYSFDGTEPIAALTDAGRFDPHFVDTANPDQKLYKSLVSSFPDQKVLPLSSTDDGKFAVIEVSSDRNPGDLYLFDVEKKNMKYLLSRRTWIEPEEMAESKPIQYTARDGKTTIHGFLTLPPDLRGSATKLPMVVFPHGGPLAINDRWHWDPNVQALASRGYAVLQPNFRGSSGFGASFLSAGRYAWGTTMIDDISDGTRWAIQQGYADPARICIYGGSYGGYAALMSAIREPALYRCAIGYAGVYDLMLHQKTSDTAASKLGRDYFKEFVSRSDEDRMSQSPVNHLDQLRAAVMIVHGEEDKRVPVSQAKELMRALDERKYPYESLIRPNEGHGFYDPKDVELLFERVNTFLDRNIGASVSSGDAGGAVTALPDVPATRTP